MNIQDIKKAIADRMLNEYELGNNGMVDLRLLESELGAPWHSIASAAAMLHEQEILILALNCTSARLTPYGVKTLKPQDIGVSKHPPTNVTNNTYFSGHFSQSAISAAGDAHVSVQNTEVNNFFQQLEMAIDQSSSIPSEQKGKWKANLSEMSKHPALVAALGAILGG